MKQLIIGALLVIVLTLFGFTETKVIAATPDTTQVQDQNVLEKTVKNMQEQVKDMQEQVIKLQNQLKMFEPFSPSSLLSTFTRIEAYTNSIWYLLVLIIIMITATIIIACIIGFNTIPGSIDKLTDNLNSNLGQSSALNTMASELKNVATNLGSPINDLVGQLRGVASSTGPINNVAGQLHELVNNLGPVSPLTTVANRLQDLASTLGANSSSLTTHLGASSSLANVADRLHLIATNLNTLANKLDTQSPLENVAATHPEHTPPSK